MKVRIFNKGHGWYISANNYRDKEDKCYINVGFSAQNEPAYTPTMDSEFIFKDIDVIEGKFTSYKNKAGFFVFKYEFVDEPTSLNQVAYDGGERFNRNVELSPEDLPFI